MYYLRLNGPIKLNFLEDVNDNDNVHNVNLVVLFYLYTTIIFIVL